MRLLAPPVFGGAKPLRMNKQTDRDVITRLSKPNARESALLPLLKLQGDYRAKNSA